MKAIYPIIIIVVTSFASFFPARTLADERQQANSAPDEHSAPTGAIRAEVFGNLGVLGRRNTEFEGSGVGFYEELAPSLGAGVGLSLLLGEHFGIGGRFEVTRFANAPNQGIYFSGGLGGLGGLAGFSGSVGVAALGPALEDFVVLDVALLPRIRFPIPGSRAAVYGVAPIGVSIYDDSQTGLRYGGMAGLETFLSEDFGFFSELGYQVRARTQGNEDLGYTPYRTALSELSIRLGLLFSP